MENRTEWLVKYAVEHLLDTDLSSECWTEEDIEKLEKVKNGELKIKVIED